VSICKERSFVQQNAMGCRDKSKRLHGRSHSRAIGDGDIHLCLRGRISRERGVLPRTDEPSTD
jgi:hypothetical protein